MNSSGAALLSNPHPCSHIVYPYSDEGLVGQAVCLFASAGLRDGDGVVLIMSQAHCDPIKTRLAIEGFDVPRHEATHQLICAVSEDLLAQFVADGLVDEDRFRSTISGLIQSAMSHTGEPNSGKVRVFGEMVSQLRSTNLEATTQLEALWNEIIDRYQAALLCTYAMNSPLDSIPVSLIDLHSHNIEREK